MSLWDLHEIFASFMVYCPGLTAKQTSCNFSPDPCSAVDISRDWVFGQSHFPTSEVLLISLHDDPWAALSLKSLASDGTRPTGQSQRGPDYFNSYRNHPINFAVLYIQEAPSLSAPPFPVTLLQVSFCLTWTITVAAQPDCSKHGSQRDPAKTQVRSRPSNTLEMPESWQWPFRPCMTRVPPPSSSPGRSYPRLLALTRMLQAGANLTSFTCSFPLPRTLSPVISKWLAPSFTSGACQMLSYHRGLPGLSCIKEQPPPTPHAFPSSCPLYSSLLPSPPTSVLPDMWYIYQLFVYCLLLGWGEGGIRWLQAGPFSPAPSIMLVKQTDFRI